LLSQPKAAHGLPDLDNQSRFDLESFRVRQSKIGIRVAGESVTNDLGCMVHKDVRITWKDSSGTEKEAELFAGVVELNNQFKIERFDVDTL
jgi:hypothetical protein